MTKQCAICQILSSYAFYKERAKRFKPIYERAIVLIVRSRLIERKNLIPGSFCCTEHLEKAIALRKLYKKIDLSELDKLKARIEAKISLKTDLQNTLRKTWNNGGSVLYLKNLAKDIVCCDRAKARYIKAADDISRKIKLQSGIGKITVIDIMNIINNKPAIKTDKTTDDQLLKAALSYQATGSLSVAGKLHKMALQRIEENQMDTDGFDFSSLDSDFSTTGETGE